MNDNKDIQIFEQDTENVLVKTLTGLAEGLTGIATSSKNLKENGINNRK